MGIFSAFNITDATYKTVDGVGIEASVLTAKNLPPGKHPVILRFHGGFLITGSRLYADWFPNWLLEYAINKQAILISADYRLMPEATGTEILSDISSLFEWLRTELPFLLSPFGVEADSSQILVTGESAGGYLAVQSALLFPDVGIKIVVCAFGVLHLKTRFFTEDFEKTIVGTPPLPKEILDNHLRDLKGGKLPSVVPAGESQDRENLALCAVQSGRYVELLGQESELYPMENLEKRKDGEVPPMFLFHGDKDTAVPVEGSQAFAEKLKTLHPSTDLLLTIEPGREHGYDRKATLEDEWVKNGIDFIDKYWP